MESELENFVEILPNLGRCLRIWNSRGGNTWTAWEELLGKDPHAGGADRSDSTAVTASCQLGDFGCDT